MQLVQPSIGNVVAKMDSLYLHIPFCFHKCHYCDFYSIVPSKTDAQARYDQFTSRLIDNLAYLKANFNSSPATVFVGGGTPTFLPACNWKSLLEAMNQQGWLENVSEFTVEANPETVTLELLEQLVAGGVNRMSVGAQSFNETHLKTLERWHDPRKVSEAVGLARRAGIANLNVDLIFAIPGQTVEDVQSDLDAALSLNTEHMSYYNLTYEPNTAMKQKLAMGQVTAVDEDTEAAMYELILSRMAEKNFEHYEISNWCKSGLPCEHNLIYWKNGNWVGAGPAAASHVDGWRWKNQPSLGPYLDSQGQPPAIDVEHLPEDQRVGEVLMMYLRLRQGMPIGRVEKLIPNGDWRYDKISELTQLGLLEKVDDHLRLSRNGLLVGDAVLGELL
ncbi:MAG TPA: coproporphyrinogen III oxidase [Phycisphaerales bacterium]|nr:coproporphyrinogen III oxidase [Phycisphaerales bacterium]HCD34372.1 coproporphyrinogen III oxidase [Phycisphaerales bacterium]|tara:strand:- start:57241 stop:58407 length:1167 start_codon:yes stop_codon:yes gene_type:complete